MQDFCFHSLLKLTGAYHVNQGILEKESTVMLFKGLWAIQENRIYSYFF